MKKIHDLLQNLLCLIFPGHITEFNAGGGLDINLGIAFSEAHGIAYTAAHLFGKRTA